MLSELDQRADALKDGESQFEKKTNKLKNKFWLQNLKVIIIVGLILIILLYFKISYDHQPRYFQSGDPSLQWKQRNPGSLVQIGCGGSLSIPSESGNFY